MEATRLSNTKGLIVPLDYASTILARVEAERDSLRAENARLREASQKFLAWCNSGIDGFPDEEELSKAVDLARAALAGSR